MLLITIFMGIQHVYSQSSEMKFEHLSVNEGLSQSTVFSVLQDRNGFIWMGTRTGGLNKYDGYSFTHYKKDPDNAYSISGNEIISLFEDSKGVIWAGTRNEGLNRFDAQTERFYTYLSEGNKGALPDNTIHAFCEDSNDQLWIGTNNGLAKYDIGSNSFIEYANSLTDSTFGQIYSLCQADEGEILVGTKNTGLYIFDVESGEVLKWYKSEDDNPSSLSENSITALLFDSQGRLWAGTRNIGLNRCDNLDSGEFVSIIHNEAVETSLASNIIRTLWEDKEGNIWIGTKDGLELLLPTEHSLSQPGFVHFKNENHNNNSLSQNSIYSFIEDFNGNFWVGTWSGGVNYIDKTGQKFIHIKHQENNNLGLSYNVVSSFAQSYNFIWVGTEGGGLDRYNPTTNQFEHFKKNPKKPNGLKSDHIKSLCIDKSGDLWVGTFNGVHLYNKRNNTFTHFLDGASIYSIKEGEPNEIWLASSKCLFRIDKNSFEIKTYKYNSNDSSSISNNSINTIYKDNNQYIWIGTKNGLNLYNRSSDNFIRYTNNRDSRSSISNDFITSICQDDTGVLWIGTVDGLNRYDENTSTFTHYGEKDGLPDNVISNIIADNENCLWITTNRGLTRLKLKHIEQSKTDNDIEFVIRNYDRGDGLQGNEFIMNASFKGEDGELYFGGVNGFNVFQPHKIKDNYQEPPIVITNFKLFNKPVEIGAKNSPLTAHISNTKQLTLNHKQSVLTFEFVALNYTSPEKNQYAFLLEGFDEDWNYVGNKREATYTNLPAGDYVFRVKASNNDGIWNNEGTSISIVVKPAWYKTYLFYFILFVIVGGAIFIVEKARVEQLKKDRERLEKELANGNEEIVQQKMLVEKQEEELQIRQESEKQMKWHNRGVILLTNLISEKRNNLDLLANAIIVELVQYIEAQMGAIYFSMDSSDKIQELKLTGGYAVNDKQLEGTVVKKGEGLVGTCLKKKEILKIDDLPEDYALLGSGLGNASMSHLTLIPIIYENKVEGVIELISFEEIEEYKVKLIEAICTTLGAAIVNEKANRKIQLMLEKSKSQKEMSSAKKEELGQNH